MDFYCEFVYTLLFVNFIIRVFVIMSDVTFTTVDTLRSPDFCRDGIIYAAVVNDQNSLNSRRVLVLSEEPAHQEVITFLRSDEGRQALFSFAKSDTISDFKTLASNCYAIRRHERDYTSIFFRNLLKVETAYDELESKIYEVTRRFLAPYQSKSVSFEDFQSEHPVSYHATLTRIVHIHNPDINPSLEDALYYYIRIGLEGYYEHIQRDPRKNIKELIEPGSSEFQKFLEAIPLSLDKHFPGEEISLNVIERISLKALESCNAEHRADFETWKKFAISTETALLSFFHKGNYPKIQKVRSGPRYLAPVGSKTPMNEIGLFLSSDEGVRQLEFICLHNKGSLPRLKTIVEAVRILAFWAKKLDASVPNPDISFFDAMIISKENVIDKVSMNLLKENFLIEELDTYETRPFLNQLSEALEEKGVAEQDLSWHIVDEYYLEAAINIALEFEWTQDALLERLSLLLPRHFPGGRDFQNRGYYFQGIDLLDAAEGFIRDLWPVDLTGFKSTDHLLTHAGFIRNGQIYAVVRKNKEGNGAFLQASEKVHGSSVGTFLLSREGQAQLNKIIGRIRSRPLLLRLFKDNISALAAKFSDLKVFSTRVERQFWETEKVVIDVVDQFFRSPKRFNGEVEPFTPAINQEIAKHGIEPLSPQEARGYFLFMAVHQYYLEQGKDPLLCPYERAIGDIEKMRSLKIGIHANLPSYFPELPFVAEEAESLALDARALYHKFCDEQRTMLEGLSVQLEDALVNYREKGIGFALEAHHIYKRKYIVSGVGRDLLNLKELSLFLISDEGQILVRVLALRNRGDFVALRYFLQTLEDIERESGIAIGPLHYVVSLFNEKEKVLKEAARTFFLEPMAPVSFSDHINKYVRARFPGCQIIPWRALVEYYCEAAQCLNSEEVDLLPVLTHFPADELLQTDENGGNLSMKISYILFKNARRIESEQEQKRRRLNV